MGRNRYTFVDNDHPYFLTCTVLNWTALLGKPEIVQIILNSLRFLIENGRMVIHGWVIMENHLHLIASSDRISDQMHDFKSFTARSVVDYLKKNRHSKLLEQFKIFKKAHKIGQEFQIWEEGSHPEMIADMKMLKQKLDYIHFNPVRRGYVTDPAYWRYSSYPDYQGGSGLLPVVMIGF